jgi:hypothetical protein
MALQQPPAAVAGVQLASSGRGTASGGKSEMRIRTILGAIALVLVAAVGVWQWREHQAAQTRRLSARDDLAAIRATEARLEEPIDFIGGPMPLSAFAANIATASGLAVDLAETDLADEGIDPHDSVDVPHGTFSLRAALAHTLRSRELCCDILDQRLVITTVEASADRHRLRTDVYPFPAAFSAGDNSIEWHEAITRIIKPFEWDNVGGEGHCQIVPGGAVITQTADVHRQIRRLWSTLERLDSPPDSWEAVPVAPFLSSDAERRVLAALDQPVTAVYEETPLDHILASLAYQSGVPIVLDRQVLMEAGVSPESPVSIDVADVALRAALGQLVGRLELGLGICDEAILISTLEELESPELRPVVLYPVHDLIGFPEDDSTYLIDLIEMCVAPESWGAVGGPSELLCVRGWLIVPQVLYVHVQIERLLADLRQTLSRETTPLVFSRGADSPAAQRIRAALDRPLAIDLRDQPLTEAISTLSRQASVPIVIQTEELQHWQIYLDTRLSMQAPPAPFWLQLENLLEPPKLSWVVRDDALQVVPRGDTFIYREPNRVYDTRALIDEDLGITTPDRLEDIVSNLIEHETWMAVGGPATIQEYRGLLAVQHSEPVHKRIQCLLAAIEANCLSLPWKQDARDTQPAVVDADLPYADDTLYARLQQPVDVDFCGEPIRSAVARLAELGGIDISWNEDAVLAPLLVAGDELATHSARGQPLGDALEEIMRPLGLVPVPRDAGIEVNSLDSLARRSQAGSYRIKLYNAADLLAQFPELVRTAKLTPNETLLGAAGPELLGDDYWTVDLKVASQPHILWGEFGGVADMVEIGRGWIAMSGSRVDHERFAAFLEDRRTGIVPPRERWRRELDRRFVAAMERREAQQAELSIEVNP